MSRKGALSNGGWLTVIAKAHLPADVLLWLDMSVFFLWLKRDGEKAQMCLASILHVFFYSVSIHKHKAMGAYYFVNLLERVTFRGLLRCQLPFTYYLKDSTFSKELEWKHIKLCENLYMIWVLDMGMASLLSSAPSKSLHGCTKKDVLKSILGQCCMVLGSWLF